MRNTTSTKRGARVPRRSGVVAGLFVVPKLEEVAVDDRTTEMLDAHTTDLLETTAIAALSALRKRKLSLRQASMTNRTHHPDRLLKAKETAERLGVGVDWVYHNQHKLPFMVRLGTVPRFSENGLEEYIRKRLNC
jgi:predicted DNA-binding transcriptional regulator AlpA